MNPELTVFVHFFRSMPLGLQVCLFLHPVQFDLLYIGPGIEQGSPEYWELVLRANWISWQYNRLGGYGAPMEIALKGKIPTSPPTT